MRVTVIDVTPFDAQHKLVTAQLEWHTGMWWWKRKVRLERQYLTQYGHVFHAYPDGDRVQLELESELGEAFHEYRVRGAIDDQIEAGGGSVEAGSFR